MFDNVKRQIDHSEVVVEKVRQDVAEWKKNNKDVYEQDARMARKWFAQDFAKDRYSALYFAEFDGRLDELISSMSTSKYINMFKIGEGLDI